MNGAMNGAILENYVVSEIIKSYTNHGVECGMWFYRDKDSKEIDVILEHDGELHPIEIKKSVSPPDSAAGNFHLLSKASLPCGTGAVICLKETLSAMNSQNFIVPVWMI